jgi:hypothetical protein
MSDNKSMVFSMSGGIAGAHFSKIIRLEGSGKYIPSPGCAYIRLKALGGNESNDGGIEIEEYHRPKLI